MAKYNYDKKLLKGLGTGAFLAPGGDAQQGTAAAPDTIPSSIFNANILAKRLHPAVQHCVVASVTDHGDAKSFVLTPDADKGTSELAFFRASQYVSVTLNIDGALVHKPYTIRLRPRRRARHGEHELHAHHQAHEPRLRLGIYPRQLESRATRSTSPARSVTSTTRACATPSTSSPSRAAAASRPSTPWPTPS